jgi:deoxyribose-phosphate aldolase
MPTVPAAEFASKFDHTALKPDVTAANVSKLCAEAHQYGFASVCVNPSFVSHARAELERLAAEDGTPRVVKVCTVIGFPLGATLSHVKAFEANAAVDAGAEELDMVLAVGSMKGRSDVAAVTRDLAAVADVAHRRGVLLKVILETTLLDATERDTAVWLAAQTGCHFVKTSTGFAKGGATVEDVSAMAKESAAAAAPDCGVEGGMRVKASGGIRSCLDAMNMVAAGASRIGASSSVAIFEECAAKGVLTGVSEHVRRSAKREDLAVPLRQADADSEY